MRRFQDIPHPQGKMQNQDIDTDKPGRVFDSFGNGRHSTSPRQEPTENIAQQFALDLPEMLSKRSLTHAYDKLILVAGLKFPGLLRCALDKNTESLVMQTVNKELLNVTEEDLAEYLK